MRRREFITLVGSAAAWPLAARAQQPAKVPRIGFLGFGPASADADRVEALTGCVELINTDFRLHIAACRARRLAAGRPSGTPGAALA